MSLTEIKLEPLAYVQENLADQTRYLFKTPEGGLITIEAEYRQVSHGDPCRPAEAAPLNSAVLRATDTGVGMDAGTILLVDDEDMVLDLGKTIL
ncbi:MAG: hypothetical protein A2Z13_09105 [Deltaproteobacteria bacterium RBG_16_64_85]|nr:MAG: hypothetical protein A2Z13_09105 [Deltaproteobacteria bacterium RBG_16_64_85]